MPDWPKRRLHFIGIGGAGMSGLALVCRQLGAEVSGSDRASSTYLDRVREAGIPAVVGHDPANVPAAAEVVLSTAIGPENPELAIARERKQPEIHRGALLAELCAERRLIAIAGTHGKTTTAAMTAWALRELGGEVAFFIGGELPTARGDQNAAWGDGEWAVAEADESDASFLELRPEVAVITNVEMDHHSRWGSLAELSGAFRRFAEPAIGVVVPAELTALAGPGQRVVPFGDDEPLPELAVPGRHNALNALAALAAIELAGFDREAAAAALAEFPGVRRRLELRGEAAGARIFDDYGHHPTEVAAALVALRELEPARLLAVFQPHLYSRTKAMAERFGAALALADEVGVLDVYAAREQPVGELEGVSGLDVARAAADRSAGRPVWWLGDIDRAERAFRDRLGQGDVLVTIGAGDVFQLADRLVGDRG
jgi:UDP-N-acetylmuramate--alanine ligase